MELNVELRLQIEFSDRILLLQHARAHIELNGMSQTNQFSSIRAVRCGCVLVIQLELNTRIQFGESIALDLCYGAHC